MDFSVSNCDSCPPSVERGYRRPNTTGIEVKIYLKQLSAAARKAFCSLIPDTAYVTYRGKNGNTTPSTTSCKALNSFSSH